MVCEVNRPYNCIGVPLYCVGRMLVLGVLVNRLAHADNFRALTTRAPGALVIAENQTIVVVVCVKQRNDRSRPYTLVIKGYENQMVCRGIEHRGISNFGYLTMQRHG